jgi:hypothetical protein
MLAPKFGSATEICEISGLECQIAKRTLGGGHGRALSLC